jgi:hypothetical protein
MTLHELIVALHDRWKTAADGRKDVIVDVGTGPVFPDVVGIGPPNEDTVVLVAKVVE